MRRTADLFAHFQTITVKSADLFAHFQTTTDLFQALGRLRDHGQRYHDLLRQDRHANYKPDDRCSDLCRGQALETRPSQLA